MEKVIVDKDKCIGCGACVGLVDDVFEFGDDDLAEVKKDVKFDKINGDLEESVKDAIESCPTSAIVEE